MRLFLTSLIFSLAFAYFTNSNVLNFFALFTGILYVLLMGVKNKLCFIVGVFNALIYAYIAYINRLFGEVFLYLLCYFPMMIYGYFYWNKNTLIKTLNLKNFILIYIAIFIIAYFYSFYLQNLESRFIYLESFIFSSGLIATILSLKKIINHYIYISISNIASIYIWTILYIEDSSNLAVLMLMILFFILGIIYLFSWKKDLK
ncbi:nicotinamide riboside transporter PnuC [Campylobacter sp. RM12651]|uniref:nicotinamide riboside transporter PnuC n=1 Tax=Campylobacter sp. RM12651 TaxID=1660079 RepID=UPI001EFA591E|nr:nicotinamide riboside transporter PnuC [Campylobacter sp. RM12651]ULO02851.1 nicotinamide mononucleotide transporter [Campylobacter sp. RM12651]